VVEGLGLACSSGAPFSVRHLVQKMRRLDARPMRRVITDTEADFHRRSPNCCGRITARIADKIHIIAVARAAEMDARNGGFGGQNALTRPNRRFEL
jgi:hypothetical protein